MAFNILDLVKIGKVTVCHADLLPLVHIGRSAERHLESCHHFGSLFAVRSKVGKTRDEAGLIVVFKIAGIPLKRGLPLGEALHQAARNKLGFEPLDNDLITLHVLKSEYHIELLAFGCAKVTCLGNIHKHRFANGERAIRLQYLAAERFEDLVASLGGKIVLLTCEDRARTSVLERVFVNDVDNVATETDHTLIQPKAHNALDLLEHLGVVPVEVGLLFGEQVQVVFVLAISKPRPRTLGKKVAPVVGDLAVLPFFDDVIVLVFFFARKRAAEPFVLVGRVIDNEIHHNADASLFCLGNQLLKVCHRAKLGLNGGVVGNVVAVVIVGADVDGREPDGIDAKIGKMIQSLNNAAQIPHPVAGGILEGSRVNLIYDHILSVAHIRSPLG